MSYFGLSASEHRVPDGGRARHWSVHCLWGEFYTLIEDDLAPRRRIVQGPALLFTEYPIGETDCVAIGYVLGVAYERRLARRLLLVLDARVTPWLGRDNADDARAGVSLDARVHLAYPFRRLGVGSVAP